MLTRTVRKPVVARNSIDEKRTEIYYWWLLVAIFFEYARPGAWVSGIQAAKLNSLIPLSLLALVLFSKGLRPFGQIFADRQARWLLAFQGLLLVQVLVADVTLYASNTFQNTLGYFFLFVIIARVATSVRRLRGIFAALVVAHVFLMVMSPEIISNTEQRTYIAGGTFLGDGNDFALSLCILLPMAVALAVGARSKLFTILWWSSVLLSLLGIVGTQSRGGTLGMIAIATFLWLFSKRKASSLVVIAVFGMVVVLHASSSYFTRMSTITNYQGEGSAEGRIMVWKAATRMALEHPLFGVGSGHFPVMFGAEYKPKDYVGPSLTAHSSYFLVLGELGVPGFITLLGIVVVGMVGTMKARRRLLRTSTDPPAPDIDDLARLLNLLTASMIGYAVAGAFLSAAYYPHVFVLTGILVAARGVAQAAGAPAASAPAVRRAGARPGLAAAGHARARRGPESDKGTPGAMIPRIRGR